MTHHEASPGGLDCSEALARIALLPPDESREALLQVAEPYFTEPPADQWGTIELDYETWEIERIPFSQAETDVLRKALYAHYYLRRTGAEGSGAAREFWLESMYFPQTARALQQRPVAVWNIMTTALAAHIALHRDKGTAWEPLGTEAELLMVVRDMPARLSAH